MEDICETPYRISGEVRRELSKIKKSDGKLTSDIFKSLADPARIKIIEALGMQELCVCVLVEVIGLQYSALSYHLKNLKESGLISCEKEGNFLIYKLTEKGKAANQFISLSKKLK
ncbi:ArsR family transcriptional regulator [Methanocella sp. CWC-04]|uniref:ArsR family transcriptional regulator n=1 Tax=Methanooceanicella nereidis TaxID=2052831 RepID=A0AAP2RC99_9EURY|nr:metalloregulator ArsR/SmtB family transcription factor [Methanocella sp. CWC-04]MCD1293945.1 ArsR family transcriptional regulator [Methanocella sp. CWC-04]